MDFWSDPCLEFAFKTLTGALTVEDNYEIQGYLEEPANCHWQRDGGSTLPDFPTMILGISPSWGSRHQQAFTVVLGLILRNTSYCNKNFHGR